MDEIQKRLKETSEACLSAFEKWAGNKKDGKASEDLQEAIHELRKVASRLEIELAISERDENAAKPMPIPPHRDAKKGGGDNGNGNGNGGGNRPNRDRGRGKKSAGGGGKGGNN